MRSHIQGILLPARRPWVRSLVLFVLLLLSIALYVRLIVAAPQRDDLITPFLQVWMICFLPYFGACAFILLTKPLMGRWFWIELGLILAGALIFRVMLLPLPPGLSRDSWRYLWDARVTLHGYSPYVYAPGDDVFLSLRDFIFTNMRFRNVPTIYPPGAQLIYVLSYLLAPSNLFVLKGIFVGFDMVTCGALALLLKRRGFDPRRTIYYAWCPLPIVEFAIQGHVDVITLTFMILSVLCAASNRRGARTLTGFLIGMATLTKIYPIFLLAVVLRRRDWALLVTCFATIFLGYLPFLILGHGQVFGFFASYASEQGTNAGVVQLMMQWISSLLHLESATAVLLEHVVDLAVVGVVFLIVLVLRLRERISMEMATLLLIGTALAISTHVFPWYATALLPWVAVLVGPLWVCKCPSGKGLAIVLVWYFTCISLLGYFFNNTQDWHVYYALVYDVVMVGLGVAAVIGLLHLTKRFFIRNTRENKPQQHLLRR